MRWIVLLFVGWSASAASPKRYDNYHVITLGPFPNLQERTSTLQINAEYEKKNELIIWKESVGLGEFDVMLGPDVVQEYLGKLPDVPHHIVTENVQVWIDRQTEQNNAARLTSHEKTGETARPFAPEYYMTYAELTGWLDNIAASFPILSEPFDLGTSYEGRSIKGIKITAGEGRPRIWMDCGIHAREWIAPATCVWIIDKLLNDYLWDNDVARMVNNYEWYIVPVLNPDGYVYSHTTDRMWRKTRTPGQVNATCIGTDANRNFDSFWGTSGVSSDECSLIFPGHAVWSEPCISAVRDYVTPLTDNMVMFLTLHSYGQMWMVPWSYTADVIPPDDAAVRHVANRAVETLFLVHENQFYVDSPPNLLGNASGTAIDWAKLQGIAYPYAIELRPRSTPEGGFLIDPIPNIRHGGEEFFYGLVAATQEIG